VQEGYLQERNKETKKGRKEGDKQTNKKEGGERYKGYFIPVL
jgi:hypothetical protein